MSYAYKLFKMSIVFIGLSSLAYASASQCLIDWSIKNSQLANENNFSYSYKPNLQSSLWLEYGFHGIKNNDTYNKLKAVGDKCGCYAITGRDDNNLWIAGVCSFVFVAQ